MKGTSTSRRAALVGLLLVLGPDLARAELPVKQSRTHLGVAECASPLCHGAVHTDASTADVRLDEYRTWLQKDSHAKAYRVLLEPRSQRIAQNLGIAAAETSDLCLDCHATNVPPALRGPRFHLSDGVGCEACHGSGEGWIDSHVAGASHAENVAAGMYPTDDPVRRAELCLSCHLGTRDQFVSHRLMAAGHPRMSFELETFSQLQPHFEIDEDYVRRKGRPDPARTWAVGELVGANAYLELFEARSSEGGWPEFGVFDCHSCHQSIANPDAVGQTPVDGGLPRLREHSLVASLEILRVVDPDAAAPFKASLNELVARVARGATGQVAPASALRRLLAGNLERVAAWQPDPRQARALSQALARRYARWAPLSYTQAEGATMALQATTFVLLGGKTGAPVRDGLDGLFEATATEEDFDEGRFRRAMGHLAEQLDTGR